MNIKKLAEKAVWCGDHEAGNYRGREIPQIIDLIINEAEDVTQNLLAVGVNKPKGTYLFFPDLQPTLEEAARQLLTVKDAHRQSTRYQNAICDIEAALERESE